MTVGIEDAAEEIHEKATQFDHLMCLIKGKVLSCKTSCEKIQYLTLFPSQFSIDKCSNYSQVYSKIHRFCQRKWCFIPDIAKEKEISQ